MGFVAAFSKEFNVAAQRAYELKLPVDQIGIPVDGCVRELGRKASKDPAYLRSKKAVVWLERNADLG